MFLDMLRSETAASPDRLAAAMAGLQAYQVAERPPFPAPPAAPHRVGRASLRDYGSPDTRGRHVVLVPSLINPPDILDLGPDRSLLRWLAERGLHPWLVDWGTPGPEDRDLDIAAHVERLLVPLIAELDAPPVLVGYCLGGTMAVAAAAIAPVAGLATIAAPWRFEGYGAGRDAIAAMWASARPTCEALGVVPMEVLQAGFWKLDPARTVAKYERFATLALDSDAALSFVRLEDWANAGAPLPYAAGRSLFEDLVAADLPGRGTWHVGGRMIDPLTLDCPAIEFVSRTDRIVPAATAAGLPQRRDLAIGHVGMIVGGRARDQLWTPLADWIDALG
ncbi:alpha/beta hydrolase [uncultured Sphingomonas sp.]|uniref:alpha/beta hydrolase n=1 Tax=uncultured Sphingomonas sp. TaxID=158754 RepID=UPI0035CBEBB3